jgi:hypothetical protein
MSEDCGIHGIVPLFQNILENFRLGMAVFQADFTAGSTIFFENID